MKGPVVCRWHDGLVDAADAVMVGAIERGSGAPLTVYACNGCLTEHDLLPLDEHPADSDGSPCDRSGRTVINRVTTIRRIAR